MTPPAAGKLKIYLGYAAGVGKTYQMLVDAQELKQQGHDIVIGYFEPHGRADTIARTEGLEAIPRRKVEYRGAVFEEMDTPAILARHPEICVVDEFPHTNVPGSERTKRWEDVMAILEAGIGVLSTMNIQHLESLNDQVWQISGVRVRETIPDWVVRQADQVVMVDVTPGALVNRLLRGVVYSPEKSQRALENFFQESTLGALRELAMRQTAHESEIHNIELLGSQTEIAGGANGAFGAYSDPRLGGSIERNGDPARQTRCRLSPGRLHRGSDSAAQLAGISSSRKNAKRWTGISTSRVISTSMHV